MDDLLSNKENNSLHIKKRNQRCINEYSEIFLVKGSFKSSLVNIPISEKEPRRTIVINTISIDTSCYCEPKIKLEFNLNILKGEGIKISGINFQVFKICDKAGYKIPVGSNFFYINSNLNSNSNVLSLTIYDDNICNSKRCTYVLEAIV